MSDDPQQPGDEPRPETIRDLGARQVAGGTGGIPNPGGTGGIVMGGTGGIVMGGTGGIVMGGTGGIPNPGGTGGIVMGGTGGIPAPTLTTIYDRDGIPKPGRYVIETRQTAEIEVLENGQVVVHRTETTGGAPEPQG